ncbi:MAG: GMC family oxidoreductase [Planctomycetes bacterium]|nr:GMC family oxidoreductase [Planctomycetota bacterium]
MRELTAEFVVVGSGAGGSVVAYHLASAGARVLVLERGPWLHPKDLSHDEPSMIAQLYKDGGAQTNNDADMFVLQGSCVGGSTVLTNAVCFRMPEDVRRAFLQRGFVLPQAELQQSFARVESVLGVGPLPPELWNPTTARLAVGLESVGATPGTFQKAMLHCVGCGYCNVGCRYGRKLDASQTWVPMAVARGAVVMPDTEVVRIVHRGARVRHLLCRDRNTGEPLRVVADRFVLAGGAINTPELLLRSGLHHGRAGRRTSFNAGAIVFGDFEEPLDGFDGDQMCVHHIGERFAIEQIQNPPVSLALTLPGFHGEHAERMQRYRHLAALGVLVPTLPTGRVFLGLGHRLLRRWFDHADLRFRMSPFELSAFRDGCRTAALALLAAGAHRVHVPCAANLRIERPEHVDRIDEAMREQSDLVGFGSSHPQGGACVGSDAAEDVVDPDFRVRGLRNLFVADASLFPQSVRVNPMLSIMAVADYAVRAIGGVRPPQLIEEGPAHAARLQKGGAA